MRPFKRLMGLWRRARRQPAGRPGQGLISAVPAHFAHDAIRILRIAFMPQSGYGRGGARADRSSQHRLRFRRLGQYVGRANARSTRSSAIVAGFLSGFVHIGFHP